MKKDLKSEIKHQTEEVKEEVIARVHKLGPVKIAVLVIMAIVTICSYILQDWIFAEDGIFLGGITDSNFLNGLLACVPKLVSCIRAITVLLIIVAIVLEVINRTLCKNRRGITVARLANSIIKWACGIVIVIVVLAIWGVDTTALITGAGVITLVVGLGLQSLIADVVAGLFIVLENEFNVGDIVTVDGFRGEVTAIGIRATKIELCGNVKIINNSEIVSLLNQSVKPSWNCVQVDIGYGDPLSRVEEVINKNLPSLLVDGAVEPINYDGVVKLGATSITLQFSTYCEEGDYYAVQRAMNRAIKKMFDENGVDTPYCQVAVRNAKG